MKVCDLTQFHSPVSGGVKRYVAEKVRCLQALQAGHEHVLVIPGAEDGCTTRAPGVREYTVRSPIISHASQYRMLLRLPEVTLILERERPEIIESADPYQLGWQAVRVGAVLRTPVVGFYHSHFPETYLRGAERFLGHRATEMLLRAAQRYVRRLYNRFAYTCVPSPVLAETLRSWGVERVVPVDLGVDEKVFQPTAAPGETASVRQELGLAASARLLLYVGRLAGEKNTHTLFAAFQELAAREPQAHLLVIGDGLQRTELQTLRSALPPERVHWLPYCKEPAQLAQYYRAAEFLVHPGLQETFGLVTVEAQACGTRVLGFQGTLMDRLIYFGLEGWATGRTAAGLAHALARALHQPQPYDRAALGRAIAARYSWGAVCQRLFDLYREAIAEYQYHHP